MIPSAPLVMKIPDRFEHILRAQARHHGAVLQTLDGFETWLKDNKLVFFPEYTDHGPEHVERVMRGAEGLIREDAWSFVTAEDAAVLLLAILLHDCAMHLSEDGFLALIGPGAASPRSPYFSEPCDRSWADTWASFLQEASRFDQQKLTSLFGTSEPARKPPPDWNDWTRRDRLLIGEFLRRQHARLAHEIALAGVPGPTEKRLGFARMDEWMRDLAGFIGRSHNFAIRTCADRMPHGGKRSPSDQRTILPAGSSTATSLPTSFRAHSPRHG
jgi:molecular chaperone HtpG